MKNKVELLAPAGSMDALKAALANGADAVYLGAASFGARSSVGFDEGALKDALDLAHLHKRRVHVTVNTLVKQRELPAVRETLGMLQRLKADAVLVQDLGVMQLTREEFPELTVHASTQMALHNAAGARFLLEAGVSRMVLARECNVETIRAIANTGIETEVFAHGALCVSASGQCLFSAMLGGRSGNRGRCAQPCRLPYQYAGKNGAWLSPRDLCTIEYLDDLKAAGVCSFKIEGRLKRAEYVAVVTRAYRNALDGQAADADTKEALQQIFCRGGFTRGYAGGAENAGVIDPERVTPAGLLLGTVTQGMVKNGTPLAKVLLKRTLHNGDGLEVDGQTVIYSGPEVVKGGEATLRLREPAKIGTPVRRTEDEEQLESARKSFAQLPLIPVDAVLTAYPGAVSRLILTDGDITVAAEGTLVQAAQSKALDEASVRSALEKMGGTAFALRDLTVRTAGAFTPVSALNALRRDGLDLLLQARMDAWMPPMPPAFMPQKQAVAYPEKRLLFARVSDPALIESLLEKGVDRILYAPTDYTQPLPKLPEDTVFCLPAQCSDATLAMLLQKTQGMPLMLGNAGQLGNAPAQFSSPDVPLYNAETSRFLEHYGIVWQGLSPELSFEDIWLLTNHPQRYLLPVYGRTRLMLLNHCPLRTAKGLQEGHADCRLCDSGNGAAGTALTDRLGAKWPLYPTRLPEGCTVGLYSDKPLNAALRPEKLRTLQTSFLLTFTDETAQQVTAIVQHYRALMDGKTPVPLKTGNLYRLDEGVL